MRLVASLGALSILGRLATASKDKAFTAQDMLAAPRPHAGIVSPDRHHALSVVDQWDPKHDKMGRNLYLVSLDSSASSPVSLLDTTPGQAGDFVWLDDHAIGYLNGSSFFSLSVRSDTVGSSAAEPSKVFDFPEGVNPTGLQYSPDSKDLVFQGQVWSDEDFDTTGKHDKAYEERGSTGVVYDELFVRHWDAWRTPGKVWTIGSVRLNHSSSIEGASMGKPTFVNLLKDTGLTSQSDPHGSVSVSSTHVAFAVKSLRLNMALHTREDVYLVALPSRDARPGSAKELTPHEHGAIGGLSFSPDGKKLAWLELAEDGYESDRRVVVVHTLEGKGSGQSVRWTEKWDQSPNTLTWMPDGIALLLLAEHNGKVLPYHLESPGKTPSPLLHDHAALAITALSHHRLFLTIASLTSPSDDYILDLSKSSHVTGGSAKASLHQLTNWSAGFIDGRLDDLGIEELWFKGADEWDVMAWIVKPAGFDSASKSKFPMAFFVHGGPQGSWTDSWSTRWNIALFAARGYFVVAVNPTGSTGYGQEFSDKIKQNWGGSPFKDLLAGYQATLAKYPQIDRERTAMLGGSYGGYMANWIQGHNDHFRFKAIVNHDGIFSTAASFYQTDEVYFPQREFGGRPTSQRLAFEKWNPSNHVAEWKTPQLVIHSAKDYRIADSDAIATFTALQVQGVPSRFLYFPDENHWVLKPHNSMKWHHEVFRWLEEWIGKGEVAEDKTSPSLVLQQ